MAFSCSRTLVVSPCVVSVRSSLRTRMAGDGFFMQPDRIIFVVMTQFTIPTDTRHTSVTGHMSHINVRVPSVCMAVQRLRSAIQ